MNVPDRPHKPAPPPADASNEARTNHRPLVLLRLPEVMARVALKKSAIYKFIQVGEFPRTAKLGMASAWPEHEIDEWLQAKLAARTNRGRATGAC